MSKICVFILFLTLNSNNLLILAELFAKPLNLPNLGQNWENSISSEPIVVVGWSVPLFFQNQHQFNICVNQGIGQNEKKIIFGVIWIKTPTQIFVNFWKKGAGQLQKLGETCMSCDRIMLETRIVICVLNFRQQTMFWTQILKIFKWGPSMTSLISPRTKIKGKGSNNHNLRQKHDVVPRFHV